LDQAIWVYPWDVLDDSAAADEIALLGIGRASVAACYHTTRALLPHNPRRKLLFAEHAAAYFPLDPARYAGLRLRPAPASWVSEADPFGAALDALKRAGQRVNAWTVVLHNSRLGRKNRGLVLQNAFGDRYTYALCPAQPEVQAYAAALIADLVHRYPIDGLELEACGYMGVDHLSHHDKIGMRLDLLHRYLLSVCFCDACRKAIAGEGLDAEHIRVLVVDELNAFFRGESFLADDPDVVDERLADLLGAEQWQALGKARDNVTFTLLDAVLATLPKATRPEVIISAGSSRHQTGACIGANLAGLASRVEGLLVALFGETETSAQAHVARMVQVAAGQARLVAGVRAFWPDTSAASDLVRRVQALKEAGAGGFRYYHYGICPRPALVWIAEAARIAG